MELPLSGRIALVTGASRGIGHATAIALARAGAHVILTARTEGGLVDAEDAIHGQGGTATIAPLDLLDGPGVARLGEAVGARWGRLDLLVLNAGLLGSLTPVWGADAAEFERVLRVNVLSAQAMIAAFDPWLRRSQAGRVIALTSSVATRPRAYWGPYAASKAALEVLVRTYAEEVRALSAIRVAILNPGATATAMRARAYPGEDQTTLPQPAEVAARILAVAQGEWETGARFEP